MTGSTSAGSTVTGDTTTTSSTASGSTTSSIITTTPPPGAGGACGDTLQVLDFIDFEDGTTGRGYVTGTGAQRPWAINAVARCNGSSNGLSAGTNPSSTSGGGVDSNTSFTLTTPPGTTHMSYFYSYTSHLDAGDDFHVYVDGVLKASYETGDGASCAKACIEVSENVEVKFYCESGGNNEFCHIDQIRFQGIHV